MAKKLTLMSILALFLSFPFVLAETHTVRGDLNAFFNFFSSAFRGNFNADYLVTSAPLIGLIVVVFGLTYFIAVTTIFKDEAHHKYARMIAIGIAILGLAQQSVYNAILSWSTIFLIVAFVTAVIFMFIIFLNHTRKNHYDTAKAMREAHASDLVAKKSLYKIKHDVAMDKKYYQRVTKDLNKLNNDLDEIISLAGSEKNQVDEIARLLQSLASAAQKGEQGLVHQYAQALGNHIGALISSMKHEDVLDNDVNSLVEKVNSVLSHWSHNEMKDEKVEKQMLHIFRRIAATIGQEYDEKEYTKLMADNKLLNDHFREMHRILGELSLLREHLTSHTESLDNLGYKKKHLEASEMRDAIFDGDYSRAHKHLDTLRSIIEQEPNMGVKLKSSSLKIKNLVSEMDKHQTIVMKLVREEILVIKEKMKKDDATKKASEKIHVKYAEELKSVLYAFLGQLDQAISAAHNAEIHFPQQDIIRNKYGESITNKVMKIKLTLAESISNSLAAYYRTLKPIFDKTRDQIKDKKSTSEERLVMYRFLEHSDFNNLYRELSQLGLGDDAPALDKTIRNALGNLTALVHELYQRAQKTKERLIGWEQDEAKDLTDKGVKTTPRDLKGES